MRLAALGVLAAWSMAAGSEASVKITWRYKNLPSGMELRAVAEGKEANLWMMGVADTLAETPAGDLIPGAEVKLRPGDSRLLVLTYSNKGKVPIHFFAAPHSIAPPEKALGCQFLCLCVDEVYTVPPGNTWYRVVKLQLRPEFAESSLAITHVLVGRSAGDPLRRSER